MNVVMTALSVDAGTLTEDIVFPSSDATSGNGEGILDKIGGGEMG
jgi:hypothetical protein